LRALALVEELQIAARRDLQRRKELLRALYEQQGRVHDWQQSQHLRSPS